MKIWKIISIALFVLLISAYGWLLYRENLAYKQNGPVGVESIIALNLDDLIMESIKYKAFKPSSWFSKSDSTSKKENWIKHVELPAIIFAYTHKDFPNTLFTSLPVKDQDQLKISLEKQFGISWKEEKEFSFSEYTGSNLINCIVAREQLYIMWSMLPFELSPEIITNFLSEAQNQFLLSNVQKNKIIEDGGLLSFQNDSTFIGFDIDNKTLKLSIHWPVGGTLNQLPFINDFVSMGSDKEFSLFTENADVFQLNIYGQVARTDSVTSYTYDDNFEKVETVTVVTDTVPGIYLKLSGQFNPEYKNFREDQLKQYGLNIIEESPEFLLISNNRKAISGHFEGKEEFVGKAFFQKGKRSEVTITHLQFSGNKEGSLWNISGQVTFAEKVVGVISGLNL